MWSVVVCDQLQNGDTNQRLHTERKKNTMFCILCTFNFSSSFSPTLHKFFRQPQLIICTCTPQVHISSNQSYSSDFNGGKEKQRTVELPYIVNLYYKLLLSKYFALTYGEEEMEEVKEGRGWVREI